MAVTASISNQVFDDIHNLANRKDCAEFLFLSTKYHRDIDKITDQFEKRILRGMLYAVERKIAESQDEFRIAESLAIGEADLESFYSNKAWAYAEYGKHLAAFDTASSFLKRGLFSSYLLTRIAKGGSLLMFLHSVDEAMDKIGKANIKITDDVAECIDRSTNAYQCSIEPLGVSKMQLEKAMRQAHIICDERMVEPEITSFQLSPEGECVDVVLRVNSNVDTICDMNWDLAGLFAENSDNYDSRLVVRFHPA